MKKYIYSLLLLMNLYSDDIDFYRGNIIDSDLLNIISFQTNKKNIDKSVNMYSIGYYKDMWKYKTIFEKKIEIQLGAILGVHEFSTDTYEGDFLIRFKLNNVIKDIYGFNMGFSFAEGISYVTGDIDYEDGTKDNPDEVYHFQNYLQFQANLGHGEYKDFQLFFRIHHRSGVYGIVAPPKVGSNFVGLGINYKL